MPKGRMLNKSISLDKKVANLKPITNLLYTWLIPYQDVKGRMIALPATVKGLVVPRLGYMTQKVIKECLCDMVRNELVVIYGDEGMYLQMLGFIKNQSVNEDREAPSTIPECTDELLTNSGVAPDQLGTNVKVKLKVKVKDKGEGEGKHLHLEYVLLTPKELQSLKDQMAEDAVQYYIISLNNYIGSTGKPYKSHYHTILNWARRDNKLRPKPKQAMTEEQRMKTIIEHQEPRT